MATKTKKRKKTSFEKIDAQYGQRMKREEKREGVKARKRLKEFTTITGAKEKTKWYY